jgi:fatty acid CoA ligase FadD9
LSESESSEAPPPREVLIGRTPAQRPTYWALAGGALHLDGEALELSIPEGAAYPEPIRLDLGVVARGEELPLDGAGLLSLDLRLIAPLGWRPNWGLALGLRPDPESSEGEQATILGPQHHAQVQFEVEPGTYYLVFRPWVGTPAPIPYIPPPGGVRSPIYDTTWQRASRQSSIGCWRPEVPGLERLWTEPTRPEETPWWELDLGSEAFVDSIRVWGASGSPAGELKITLYSRLDAEGQPSFPERAFSERVRFPQAEDELRLRPRTLGRFVRLELTPDAPPAALELCGVQVLAVPLTGPTLLESFQRAFSLYSERPLFSCRQVREDGALTGYERWETYGEVWGRVQLLAVGLKMVLREPARGPEGRVFVGICAPNQPEWAIADLACLVHAFVIVPLPVTETKERLVDMASRAGLACVFAGPAQRELVEEVAAEVDSIELLIQLPPLDRSPEPELPAGSATPWQSFATLLAFGEGQVMTPVAREPDDLHTILFSSGSTGSPKGAMRSYQACNEMLTAFGVSQPAVHLSFQPLSHFSERVYLVTLMIYGGQIGFATLGERLYEELALLEPTAVAAVPRVFNLLLDRYQADLAALEQVRPQAPREELEEEVLESLRSVFGDRIQSVSVGSAPPSRALMRFLHRCFDFCRVGEGYGSTECATITVDDVVRPDVELRLEDVPELGYSTADVPPRGEILVKTPHMISGYLGDEETTRANFTEDGFFRTGDLGERGPDGTVRVIGRRKNVVKLAQGEFVAPERIEDALLASPLVAQLVIHADSLQSSVVALVVPNLGPLAEELGCGEEDSDALTSAEARLHVLADLRRLGAEAKLLPFELPSALHLELEPLSVERGLATSSNKIDRRAVAACYGSVFEALYAGAAPVASVLDLVKAAAAEVLGAAPAADADLAGELGVDSLSSVELVSVLSKRLAREIPLRAWQGAASLEELARRIQVDAGVGASGGEESATTSQAQADLAAPLELALLEAGDPEPARAPGVLLLTGCTGFLGAHLLEVLAGQKDLSLRCLVRAEDDAAAEARLRATADRYRLELDWDRVQALAGDLAQPHLGWSPGRWEDQAQEVDAILHAGAQVNWVMLYGQLRPANVIGTDTLLELAGAGRLKAFHFVSTISTAPVAGDEETLLADAQAWRSSGYGLSKWVSERRVRLAGERGLPITVHRPAMITGHSQRGVANASDFVNRYLQTCLQLGVGLADPEPTALERARCDLTPVDYVASSIAALIGAPDFVGGTAHLTNLRRSPTWAELSEHLGVRALPYEEFRRALVEAGGSAPLAPLLGWFPEAGFRMQMGPWPNEATEARLQTLGVSRPPAAAELVAAYARFHREG